MKTQQKPDLKAALAWVTNFQKLVFF